MDQKDNKRHNDNQQYPHDEPYPLTQEMINLYEEVVATHPIEPLKSLPEDSKASGLIEKLEVAPVAPAEDGPYVAVYSPTTVSLVMDSLTEGASDKRDALKPILKSMKRTDGRRRLVTIRDISAISSLRDQFPNFVDAIEIIEGAVALAARTPEKILYLSPMLLLGPPGIGKTKFAEAIAQALGTTMTKLSMGHATAGWVLGGLDLSWNGGKPGRIFDTLVQDELANPLILVDEIDKAPLDGKYDPIGPLYDLLEKNSARAFQDEAVPIRLNASHIIWMLTANDISTIPEPILSRCEVVNVTMSTGAEAEKIMHSVYASLRIDVPGAASFPEDLPQSFIERLSDQPPREMMRTLTQAMRRAALRNQYELSEADLPKPKRRQRVGF